MGDKDADGGSPGSPAGGHHAELLQKEEPPASPPTGDPATEMQMRPNVAICHQLMSGKRISLVAQADSWDTKADISLMEMEEDRPPGPLVVGRSIWETGFLWDLCMRRPRHFGASTSCQVTDRFNGEPFQRESKAGTAHLGGGGHSTNQRQDSTPSTFPWLRHPSRAHYSY